MQTISAKMPSIGTPTGSLMLPALKYVSGKREWYAVTIPYKTLGKFVQTSSVKKKNQEIIKSEIKNRFLDKKHKDDIKQYIKEEEEYTIPPITLVSYEKLPFRPFVFEENESDILPSDSLAGIIFLPIDYEFECLDGNHRSVAIRELASEAPEYIADSHMLLNIVVENRPRKIRQDFVDVNKNAKQTTSSINTLFNTRDPLAGIVADLLEEIDYLQETTELLATSVSKNSKDIYTINNLKNAVIELAGYNSQSTGEEKLVKELKDNTSEREKVKERALIFFTKLKSNRFINQCLKNRDKTPELRNESLLTSGTGIVIASRISGIFFKEFDESRAILEIEKLMAYDWSRNNYIFKGNVITPSQKISNSRESISNTVEAILKDLGFNFK
ncbi:DGQHR domain-containing protein [Anoxybacillus calidus]|uniref:DGQHR domain-containing protein n=1 Tax=[Anoxybacillus] calidus TaxID=575178 RepID=A0A7V9Z311_9BACL|nr:DNA sulfur modification protein DndB [Anoxybacillus calidus]MBA2873164.1 DGQHR domain-containing protein [Anoxybacillus calidus]